MAMAWMGEAYHKIIGRGGLSQKSWSELSCLGGGGVPFILKCPFRAVMGEMKPQPQSFLALPSSLLASAQCLPRRCLHVRVLIYSGLSGGCGSYWQRWPRTLLYASLSINNLWPCSIPAIS